MNFELRHKLDLVARRIRSLRLSITLAFCWLLWAIVGVMLFELGGRYGWNAGLNWRHVVIAAAVSAIICVIAVSRTVRDRRAIARRIEATHPELNSLLITAVEQTSLPRDRLGFLQTRVIRDAVEHSRRHRWTDSVSSWRLGVARIANFTALVLLAGVCLGLANRGGATASSASLLGVGKPAEINYEIAVDPGDCEVERGTSLVVVATFPAAVPPDATLVVADEKAGRQADTMTRSLADPKYVGRVPVVENNLTYFVEFAGRRSKEFRVTVFEYPELVRADAELVYPHYTTLEPAVVEDVRHVTAVEGTKLTLVLHLNKEVAEARLDGAEEGEIKLERDARNPAVYRATWTLTESRRLKLHLVDSAGRGSRLPPEIVVNVTPNRPPKVAIDRPARDVEVSPLEELELKANISDDFGVLKTGVSYSLGGDEPREIALADATAALPNKQVSVDHTIDFEALKAEPDQLVSYYLWAEDTGPDDQPRRVESDMYFAEVRPFDQIYRQGEQPSQNQQQQGQQPGQGGNQQEASELAELQREIINATWKLVRRETGKEPTDEFPSDSQLLVESQQSAIDRLSELAERLEDAESIAHMEAARTRMNEALKQLTSANENNDVKPLRPALSAEQGASQALLKLRAREFQVVRGNQQQQGQGAGRGGSASQRQLDQLQLSSEENRYETQSRATNPEETQAQRESREVLNRLRDLARRQDDLNQRLRELQSALQQARTDQEREELERELKRLRDQQQEILRDTDELISRVDRASNQQQSQNAREQLEQTRSNVQQASESLNEGQLSQAITEGTRAERQLSDLRDQFRQQAANRFSEEMTEMRRSARELDQRQQQLSEQLNNRTAEAGRSLRDTGERAEVGGGLGQQREQLQNLLERMRQTVEEAEEPEPLLAKQLYDTVREAHQQQVENALDVARRLVDVGIDEEANKAMRVADEGIGRVRQGVEKAAESVLGDEAEALRRAQQEVDRLAEELNQEMNERRGDDSSEPTEEGEGQTRNGEQRGGQRQNRQPQNQGQNAQNQNGGSQTTERRNGTGQEGERNQQPNERGGEQQQNSQQRKQGQQGQSQQQGDSQQQGQQAQNGQGDRGQQSGQQGGGGNQSGENQQGEPGDDRQQGDEDGTGSDRDNPGNRERSSLRGGGARDANRDGGDIERFLGGGPGGPERRGGPITGENFRNWADRLRDVEEMLDDGELRSDAARIRERAEDAREEFRRHSKEPDWTKLQDLVSDPLVELSQRIDEEIRKLESPDALVPIDRDPVPPEFAEQIRRYYERLGSGE
jgi:hypothetical protein